MKKLFLLTLLVGCGQVEPTITTPQPVAVARGIPVRFVPEKGVYAVDIEVDGKLVRDVMLDTGSSNLILVDYPGLDAPISAPFSVQYGIGDGMVELHRVSVSLGEMSRVYTVGVFTRGTDVHNILGLGFDANVVGPAVPTFLDSFTLNLCRHGTRSFIELGVTSTFHETAVIPNSFNGNSYDSYSVQPTALHIDGKEVAKFPTQQQGYVTLVDSGTNSFHYLPETVIAAIAEHYKEVVPTTFWHYSNNVAITEYQFNKLGPISVEFPNLNGGTFTVDIPPEGYTGKFSNGIRALITPAFPIRTNVKLTILGSLFITNALIGFDKQNHKLSFSSNEELCDTQKNAPQQKPTVE